MKAKQEELEEPAGTTSSLAAQPVSSPVTPTESTLRMQTSKPVEPIRTAAKTRAKGGRPPLTDELTRVERNQFDHRRRNAPEAVQKEWDRLKALPPNHPQRKSLFDAVCNVVKGDYSQCELIINFQYTQTSGTLSCGGV